MLTVKCCTKVQGEEAESQPGRGAARVAPAASGSTGWGPFQGRTAFSYSERQLGTEARILRNQEAYQPQSLASQVMLAYTTQNRDPLTPR